MIGVFWADQSVDFALFISGLMEGFIDGYSYIAPLAIYLILTPTLLKLVASATAGKSFTVYTIVWFAKARLLACLYAVIATAIVFGLPLHSQAEGFLESALESLKSLGFMLTHSVYFYAVYASLITVAAATRLPRTAAVFSKGVDLVEYLGRIFVPIIPFLMIAIGAYVTILPSILEDSLAGQLDFSELGEVKMLGVPIDITTSLGMILIYVLAALLTGVVCGIWHAGLLTLAKRKMPEFSLRSYFADYWVKVYPLLWATSSEALATPLNLYMVKKLCPNLRAEVRQFVVGTGSFLNINGTVINVFLMTGLVAAILNIDLSVLHLILLIPIVFLIAYGVPGIPGELVIFGGPIALSLGLAPEVTPVFLALYIGLQIGLPDSFRTAANSTDECLSAIILNDKYRT
jgi:Na+/H+-dicarboxylate symporter